MSLPQHSLPAATPTREEIARVEVGHTIVSPALARALAACFVVVITIVPLVEWTRLTTAHEDGTPSAWSHLTQLREQIRSGVGAPESAGWWLQTVSANRQVLAGLSAFEQALDDESVMGRTLRRPAQALMASVLGAGNERVYPGRDGWLLYRPDVEYVTGRRFLDAGQIRRRIAAAAEWDAPPQPDPRPALVQFHRHLEGRGIRLVVMPTPVKPGVHPESLSGRYATRTGVLQNPSYEAFVGDLQREGVLVFDPAEVFSAGRGLGDPDYLMTDTHWRPEAMEAVAERLAAFIEAHVPLAAAASPGYRVERTEVTNLGDTAHMLDLPEASALFPPERVWLHRVLLPDGSAWRSTRGADVLLLGDSFSNIYALESMGWGTSGGFAEQLSYALGRPLDRIIQNDEGAFATRAILQQDPSRLDGTRVVVYQFAARELAFGDWRMY
jgi:hypothetical protein